MPFFIEIIGPPGSGKTFVSNRLEKYKANYGKIFYHSNLFNHIVNIINQPFSELILLNSRLF